MHDCSPEGFTFKVHYLQEERCLATSQPAFTSLQPLSLRALLGT